VYETTAAISAVEVLIEGLLSKRRAAKPAMCGAAIEVPEIEA